MSDASACANADPLSRLEQLERENADFRTWGIIEIATRNPNVAEYMAHWEARAESAEAKLAEARKVIEDTRTIVCDGAAEGFNPLVGDWAERLYVNNGALSRVLGPNSSRRFLEETK